MTFEESKKLQEQEFKFLDTKDLRPLLTEGRTVSEIADDISELYDSEYTEEECVLNVIDNNELAEYLENRYGIRFTERVDLVLHGKAFDENTFKRKIRFICGKREYSYVEDFTEKLKNLAKGGVRFGDANELVTLDNCYKLIEPCRVSEKDIKKYQGVHEVYCTFRDFSNSYGGCVWLNDCNGTDELIIVFERV